MKIKKKFLFLVLIGLVPTSYLMNLNLQNTANKTNSYNTYTINNYYGTKE